MVQSVMAGTKVVLTSEEMQARIARAHLKGDGRGVFEIWRLIAEDKLSPKSRALWLNKVAEWIMATGHPDPRKVTEQPEVLDGGGQSSPRADHINTGLVISGLTDPKIDGVENDQWLLAKLGTAHDSTRDAPEVIWELIAEGSAGPFLRDAWLDHVAKRVCRFVNNHNGVERSSSRAEGALKALGLSGKKAADDRNVRIRLFTHVAKMMGYKPYECASPREFASKITRRMSKFGFITGELKGKDFERVNDLVRKELK